MVSARAGDHVQALHFLTSVFCGPTPGEFKASLEDPFYEPRDRLLIKRDQQILGHAQITHRVMRLGRAVVPVAGLHWLAASPEIRGRGFGALLLRRAERLMVEEKAAVGLLSTANPAFFRRFGWIDFGARTRWTASAFQILAELSATYHYPKLRRPLDIRPVRRMEIAELVRIYRRNTDCHYGPLERSEPYWLWLLNRRAYDQFLVAIDRGRGRGRCAHEPQIVGYAILKAGRVAELMTVPEHPTADIQLLCRACGEAIEQGIDTLGVYLPDGHALAPVLQAAGATASLSGGRRGEVLMAKVVAPDRMLQGLSPELLDRAEQGGLELPLELGFAVDGSRYQLALAPGAADSGSQDQRGCVRASVSNESLGRSYLRLAGAQFSQLLLGTIDVGPETDRLEASTKLAREAAAVLFPRRAAWRPLFDDMRVEK